MIRFFIIIKATLSIASNVFEVRKVLNSNNIITSNITVLVLIFLHDVKPVSLRTRILSVMNNIAKKGNI
jgi:hypothetical protein